MGTGLTSPLHLVILLLIVLLLFGARRVPEIGHSIGKGMREFKGALMGEDDTPQLTTPTPEQTPAAAAPAPPPAHEHDPV